MYKYAARLAYLGYKYCGWQRQNFGLGVQEVLEGALASVVSEKISVTAAGRTDKGVNALGQIVSFELKDLWRVEKLRLAINYYLPDEIRVLKIFRVDENFDARRSADWREYKYFIWHGYVLPPCFNNFVWWRRAFWNFNLARAACKVLIGKHDFRAFCKAGECPDDSVRDLTRVKLQRWRPNLLFNFDDTLGYENCMSVLTVRAPSFLMNMVRIIVGNVDAVALGKRPLSWLEGLLAGGERAESEMTAPACGLWFWRVGYGEELKVNS